jgi:uncharacterized membrane protein
MEFYDWLLAFHVLAAIAATGALVALWALVFATRPAAPMLSGDAQERFGNLFGPIVGAGMGLALVFGVWLALDADGYELWDGWILGALVLWAIGGWSGDRSGRLFFADPAGNRATAIRLQALSSAALILILILMVWKPGA